MNSNCCTTESSESGIQGTALLQDTELYTGLHGWGNNGVGRAALLAIPDRRVVGMDRGGLPSDLPFREGAAYRDFVGFDSAGISALMEFKLSRVIQNKIVNTFITFHPMRAGP